MAPYIVPITTILAQSCTHCAAFYENIQKQNMYINNVVYFPKQYI